MKKRKILIVLIMLLLVVVFAPSTEFPFVVAADGNVTTSAYGAYEFAGGTDVTSTYVDSGISAVVAAGNANAGVKIPNWEPENSNKALQYAHSIEGDNKASFTFRIPFMKNSVHQYNNYNQLRIYVRDPFKNPEEENAQIAMLKIWVDSGGYDNGDHQYYLYGATDTDPIVGGTWIKGDATDDSSFYIQFDKENLFSSYVGGSNELTSLDDSSGTFKANNKERIGAHTHVYFDFVVAPNDTDPYRYINKDVEVLEHERSNLTDAFSLKKYGQVEIEFSAGLFADNGDEISSSVQSDALDIYVFNADNDEKVALLRIWTKSKKTGQPDGSHTYSLYFGDNWNAIEGNTYISGEAKLSSSFTVRFDKENLFSAVVKDKDGIETLDRLDNNNDDYLYNKKYVKDLDNIYFLIKGDQGFTQNTDIVLRRINNQDLSSSISGDNNRKFLDNSKPILSIDEVSKGLIKNQEFTIPTEAVDILSPISYQMIVNGETISGKTITPTNNGQLDVKLIVTDSMGNVIEKEFDFIVYDEIGAPVINKLPTIIDKVVSYYEILTFEYPIFTDLTSISKVQIKVYKNSNLITILDETENGDFEFLLHPDIFEEGRYEFEYVISNTYGTTTSQRLTATYTLEEINKPDFLIMPDNTTSLVTQYVDNGIEVRSSVMTDYVALGIYDIRYGLDIKFISNSINSLGYDNPKGRFVSFLLINKDNPNYRIMYRVWAGNTEKIQIPTNVYISTDGGVNYHDFVDAGLIDNNVDGVSGKFHMAFNLEDTFLGESDGILQSVSVGKTEIKNFFNSAPSNDYYVALNGSILGNTNTMTEFIITEFNGQSFENKNGNIIQIENPQFEITEIDSLIKQNTAINFDVYTKDIFNTPVLKVEVIAPDSSRQTLHNETATAELKFVRTSIDYMCTQLGEYTFIVTSTCDDRVITKEFKVMVKDKIDPVEISLSSFYEDSYLLGDTLTLLTINKSLNVVSTSIEIVKPNGISEIAMYNEGTTYRFTSSGEYTFRYIAIDDAKPEVNQGVLEVKVLVNDDNIRNLSPTASLKFDFTKYTEDVKDEETKRAISVLRLRNVEQQIKENIQKESIVLAS